MTLAEQLVLKEKNRIEFMIDQYEKRLLILPKGTITKQENSSEKIYYYLKYREDDKVISKYIQPESVKDLVSKIEERKHIESMLKPLRQELKFVNHALGVKK